MKFALLAIFLALPLAAQDFICAGASFNGTTTTPFGCYAKSLGSGIYAITSEQVTQITLKPAIAFQTVTVEDIGYDFTNLLPAQFQQRFSLIGIGGAGASATSAALTGAFDGGGLGVIKTARFNILLGARVIRTPQAGTQTVPVVAIAFKLSK